MYWWADCLLKKWAYVPRSRPFDSANLTSSDPVCTHSFALGSPPTAVFPPINAFAAVIWLAFVVPIQTSGPEKSSVFFCLAGI